MRHCGSKPARYSWQCIAPKTQPPQTFITPLSKYKMLGVVKVGGGESRGWWMSGVMKVGVVNVAQSSTQNVQNGTDIPNCKNSSDNFHHLCSFFTCLFLYFPFLSVPMWLIYNRPKIKDKYKKTKLRLSFDANNVWKLQQFLAVNVVTKVGPNDYHQILTNY